MTQLLQSRLRVLGHAAQGARARSAEAKDAGDIYGALLFERRAQRYEAVALALDAPEETALPTGPSYAAAGAYLLPVPVPNWRGIPLVDRAEVARAHEVNLLFGEVFIHAGRVLDPARVTVGGDGAVTVAPAIDSPAASLARAEAAGLAEPPPARWVTVRAVLVCAAGLVACALLALAASGCGEDRNPAPEPDAHGMRYEARIRGGPTESIIDRLHDDARGVTCYVMYGHSISCLPDTALAWPLPETAR